MDIEVRNGAGRGVVELSLGGISIPLTLTPAVARQVAAILIEQADKAESKSELGGSEAGDQNEAHAEALAKLEQHIAEHGEDLRGKSVNTRQNRYWREQAVKETKPE